MLVRVVIVEEEAEGDAITGDGCDDKLDVAESLNDDLGFTCWSDPSSILITVSNKAFVITIYGKLSTQYISGRLRLCRIKREIDYQTRISNRSYRLQKRVRHRGNNEDES